jgi:hypothetical protein
LVRDQYEDEALKLYGETKGKAGTGVKTWHDIAAIMTTLAKACEWGWMRTPQREYTKSFVLNRFRTLKDQRFSAKFGLPSEFVFPLA